MQQHAPEAVDLSGESENIRNLYGLDQDRTKDFGRRCLLARRLVERGVRFVQVYSGGNHNDNNWDAHGDLVKNHEYHAGATDLPVAGLLRDLKQRGLLDSTLVIWGGEFGRQPTAEYAEGTGRDHNAYGFTMWMAGGGIAGGASVGETDELGNRAEVDRFHVKNLHATVPAATRSRPQRPVVLPRRPRPEAGRRRRREADPPDRRLGRRGFFGCTRQAGEPKEASSTGGVGLASRKPGSTLTRRSWPAAALLWVCGASAALAQQTVTFEAEGASAAALNGQLELRVDGTPVEIESIEEAVDGWQTLVYIDLALTTPSSVHQLANSLLEQLDALLALGSLEIVVADPARTHDPAADTGSRVGRGRAGTTGHR